MKRLLILFLKLVWFILASPFVLMAEAFGFGASLLSLKQAWTAARN